MTYRTFDGTSQSETVTLGRYSGSKVGVSDGSTVQGALYFSDDIDTGIYSPSNGQIAFSTNGTERFKIDEDGAITFTGELSFSDAQFNTVIGTNAGDSFDGTNATHNTLIGYDAGTAITQGDYNTAVGKSALTASTTATGNTALGYMAGKDNDDKYEMCFLGRQAGMNQTMVSQELWLAHRDHNKGTASVWIHGTNAGACTQGNNSSSWTTTSDQRIKKNIVDNNVGLSAIEQLKVRNFEYRVQVETGKDDTGHTTWAPKSDSDVIDTSTLSTLYNGQKPKPHQVAINKEGTQIGMIAQEVEAVLPGCVETDANGIKSVDTDEMFWHMINGIKELSAKNKTLEADVTQLKTDNNSLVARVTALEAA